MKNGIFAGTMADMNWTEIRKHAESGARVLLPLGVLEEHGPHLCLGTDIYTAHIHCLAVRERLASEGIPSVVAPPFYWGVCTSTDGFIGSFRIRPETTKALLADLLSSLSSFGFCQVYGVSAHGDVGHYMAIVEAFRDASASGPLQACCVFPADRMTPFGFDGSEPFLCPVSVESAPGADAETPDVHAGDLETATLFRYYPELADTDTAASLPPVPFRAEQAAMWLFGGHIHELSEQGYIGNPAAYARVDAGRHVEQLANRIAQAIAQKED